MLMTIWAIRRRRKLGQGNKQKHKSCKNSSSPASQLFKIISIFLWPEMRNGVTPSSSSSWPRPVLPLHHSHVSSTDTPPSSFKDTPTSSFKHTPPSSSCLYPSSCLFWLLAKPLSQKSWYLSPTFLFLHLPVDVPRLLTCLGSKERIKGLCSRVNYHPLTWHAWVWRKGGCVCQAQARPVKGRRPGVGDKRFMQGSAPTHWSSKLFSCMDFNIASKKLSFWQR